MTSAEILQELESKAWAQGRDAGLEQGREEEARRAVRVAFECRFGAMPSILEAALAKVHHLDGLHLCLQACLRDLGMRSSASSAPPSTESRTYSSIR